MVRGVFFFFSSSLVLARGIGELVLKLTVQRSSAKEKLCYFIHCMGRLDKVLVSAAGAGTSKRMLKTHGGKLEKGNQQ